MKLELHALESNHTWELVQKPPDQLIVDCKWLFTKYSTTIKSYHFTQSDADNSLFTLHTSSHFVAVLLYVDDILITCTDKPLIQTIIQYMSTAFKVKDLGPMKYFLGIKIARSTSGIYIHQIKYTLDILQDSGLFGVKSSEVPME